MPGIGLRSVFAHRPALTNRTIRLQKRICHSKRNPAERIVLPVQTSFVLEPIPPFRLDLTAWTLRRRPDNVIDRWDGQTYRRVLVDDDGPFEISVTQLDELERARLRIFVT